MAEKWLPSHTQACCYLANQKEKKISFEYDKRKILKWFENVLNDLSKFWGNIKTLVKLWISQSKVDMCWCVGYFIKQWGLITELQGWRQ